MRTWTGRKLSFLTVSALCMLGNAACLSPSAESPDDDGQGGSTSTTPTTGAGGEGGSPPACDTKQLVTDATFAPTSGPDPYRFTHVAATSKAVFATTGTGLHRSTDGGDTWTFLGVGGVPGQPIGAIAALGDEVFVGAGQSILRSTDGGDTWEDTSTVDSSAAHYLSARGDDLFALLGGLPFRWNAAAETWDALPNQNVELANLGFDVLESDGELLYGNSLYEPGVFRLDLSDLKEDSQWTLVPDLPEWGYKALAFAGGKGFAANSTQVFRSDDAGQTWKALEADAPVDVQDLLVVGDAVLAAASSGLHVTTDQGATWAQTTMGPFASGFALATDGAHVFSASDALRRSEGAGGAWEELHVMADSVWMLSPTEGAVLSASLGGSFRTKDGGVTWEPIQLPAGEGLSWRSPAVARDGKVFAQGLQSLLVSEDDGASFVAEPLAPAGEYGYFSLFTSVKEGLVAGVSKGAGSGCPGTQDVTTTLYLSTDQGQSWTEVMNGFPVTFTDCYGEEHTPMIMGLLQVDGALLATTYHDGAYRSVDGGQSWAPVSAGEDIGELVHFGRVGDAVLAATKEGGVARSVDGGETWEKTGFEALRVSSFATAGEAVFASVGSDDEPDGGVFYSADAGISWRRVDAGFDARVRSVALLGDSLYAGTVDESTWTVELACAPEPR